MIVFHINNNTKFVFLKNLLIIGISCEEMHSILTVAIQIWLPFWKLFWKKLKNSKKQQQKPKKTCSWCICVVFSIVVEGFKFLCCFFFKSKYNVGPSNWERRQNFALINRWLHAHTHTHIKEGGQGELLEKKNLKKKPIKNPNP
jgi:hypothetical protein